jgi:GntR family transcriptional repressor for pyruvate dehydrogenase complex
VREALRILERSGFIRVKAGVKGGPIIEDTVHRKMAALFLDASRFNRVSLEDYAAALLAIDCSLMDFVFQNADESDIADLRSNITEAKRKLGSNKPAFDENIDFHRLLAKSTKNYVFRIIMESILAVLYDFRSKLTPFGDVEPSRIITESHEQIIEAILAKDKTRALTMIEKDLSTVRQILTGQTGKKSRTRAPKS